MSFGQAIAITARQLVEEDDRAEKQDEDRRGDQAQQRRDSIEAYEKGGRQDLADRERAELAIILEYLPEQMSRREITRVVERAIEETGASGPRDVGKVMGRVMPVMSVSWNASEPMARRATCPVTTTMGTESMYAVAIPVTRFVAPGPDVANATPGRPVALA